MDLCEKIVVEVPDHGSKIFEIPFYVNNLSQVIAVWWQVVLIIPKAILGYQPNSIKDVLKSENIGGTFSTIFKDDCYRVTFHSQGDTSLFFDTPLELGKIHIKLDSQMTKNKIYEISYSVITDKGKTKDNHLSIITS
jgi:hypothetical protein